MKKKKEIVFGGDWAGPGWAGLAGLLAGGWGPTQSLSPALPQSRPGRHLADLHSAEANAREPAGRKHHHSATTVAVSTRPALCSFHAGRIIHFIQHSNQIFKPIPPIPIHNSQFTLLARNEEINNEK